MLESLRYNEGTRKIFLVCTARIIGLWHTPFGLSMEMARKQICDTNNIYTLSEIDIITRKAISPSSAADNKCRRRILAIFLGRNLFPRYTPDR